MFRAVHHLTETRRVTLRIRPLLRLIGSASALAACLAVPGVAAAQSAVHGRVVDDETDYPVAGASVELLTRTGAPVATTIADGRGMFRFRGLAAGSYSLRVGRLGYREASIHLQTNDTLEVSLRLSVEAVVLEPLEVTTGPGWSRTGTHLQEFERRRSTGFGGTFLTRDQIARHAGGEVVDLLRVVPGLRISGRPGYGGYIISSRTGCTPAVYVDAAPVFRPDGRSALGSQDPDGPGARAGSGALDALSLVHPLELEGIEVYTGPSQVPAVFGGSTALCGVIALWTRRGSG